MADKKVEIYEYQLQQIHNALRQTINLFDCKNGDTCYKRNVMQAFGWTENALKGEIDKKVDRQ